MKNVVLMYLAMMQAISCYPQTKNVDSPWLNYFTEIDIPVSFVRLTQGKEILPYDITLKYFYDNKPELMEYKEIATNMDDNTETIYDEIIKIIPCYYYTVSDMEFVVYEELAEEETLQLGILRNGMLNDKLTLYYTDEFELQTTISKIYGEIIYIFEYNSLMPYELDGSGNVTRINIKAYIIDQETNKFALAREDVIYSKTEKYLFSKYKEVPDSIKAQDPFYKY